MELSVVMSAFREPPDQLSAAVESILAQSFSEFEFILLLDDPQNQKALELLESYAAADRRVRLGRNPRNLGLAGSLNRGLELAVGEYVARMDADDIALPERLERQMEFLHANPEVDILGVNRVYIDSNGRETGRGLPIPTGDLEIKRALRSTNIMLHPGIVMKRERVLKIGGYADLPAAQDDELWLRAAAMGLKFANLDQHLMLYRQGGDSISSKSAMLQAAILVYDREFYVKRRVEGLGYLDGLERFLEKAKAYDPDDQRRYKQARDSWERARGLLRRGEPGAVSWLLRAYLSHPLLRRQINLQLGWSTKRALDRLFYRR